MGQARDHRVDNQHQQHQAQSEEEISKAARDALPAFPLVLARDIGPIGPRPRSRSYQRLRSWSISVFETRPEKITVSIGNFSIRKCVLKKWIVKINPAASSASSEWTIRAILMIHPGRKLRERLRKPHDQSGHADDEHAPEHGEIVELFPIGPAVELAAFALCRRTIFDARQNRCQSCNVGIIESGPNTELPTGV